LFLFIFLFFISSKKTNDDIVLELSKDIGSRLPKSVDLIKKGSSFQSEQKKSSNSPDPHQQPKNKKEERSMIQDLGIQSTLLVILEQEIQRFDRLLNLIHGSLNDLCLAIKGRIIMTSALEDAFNSLLNNAVPTHWKVTTLDFRKKTIRDVRK
jgi:hypothetical protein